jgi:signal transduction histidine kinase
MKRISPLHRFPLLRNLMAFQLLTFCAILGTLAAVMSYENTVRMRNAVNQARERLEPLLASKQQQWRAWDYFGMKGQLESDLAAFSNSHDLLKLEVVPRNRLPSPELHRIAVPAPDQSDGLDTAVLAEINLDRLHAREGISDADYHGILLLAAACLVLILISAVYIRRNIYQPMLALGGAVEAFRAGGELRIDRVHAQGEMKEFLSLIGELYRLTRKAEKSAALAQVAAQVAHDIRSPLAAIEMVTNDLSGLPEEERIIVRSAFGRIKDIANHLLADRGSESNAAGPEGALMMQGRSVQLLPSLIDRLASEARLRHRSRLGVSIDFKLNQEGYGLFAEVNPIELMRVLANLITNSVEAIGDHGSVCLSLARSGEGSVEVRVVDDGAGIPPEILPHLTTRGFTFGKEGGHGLGLHHARAVAESLGGSLLIQSSVGKGTTVTLKLPQAHEPEWFVPELTVKPGTRVVVLDDDPSIHQIWQGRFPFPVIHFSSADELRFWWDQERDHPTPSLFLIDYELIGSTVHGIEIIEELGIQSSSVLVTSRFEEVPVRDACRRLGVRLIPKGMAGFVPVRIAPATDRPDAVLIDDDPLIHMLWKHSAAQSGRTVRSFSSPEEFRRACPEIDPTARVYIDSCLGAETRGEIFAREIHEMGFREIHLTTGSSRDQFPPMFWIRSIRGKEPPWVLISS